MKPMRITILIVFVILFCPLTVIKAEEQKRGMTFLDIFEMENIDWHTDISPDGKWFIYTISVPDWKKNKEFSDIYLTPLSGGKTKQMTFTKDKSEYLPIWYKDSSIFAFLSEDSENMTQIFFMARDRGEAWKITDDSFGVSSYEWSKDWNYLTYLGGEPDQKQVWIMPGKGGVAEKLTNHNTPISSYLWNPNNNKLYFTAIDSIDLLDKERKEKGFDVKIEDVIKLPLHPLHLWEIDIETKEEKRLTGGNEYSVSRIVISDDGTKIAFRGSSTKRDVNTWRLNMEIFLFDLNTNTISRVTNNLVGEWSLSFSPDCKKLAFFMPDGEKEFINLGKIYIVPIEGGEIKKLLNNYNYDGWISFWSDDSRHIYFDAQIGVNHHLCKVSIESDQLEQITKFDGDFGFTKDKDSGKYLIRFSDSKHPVDYYSSEPENFNDRDKWIKLTDSNPQVKDFLLGKYETIRWKSTDKTTIEGLLVKPNNFLEGRKYPLIVQIHGGPHDTYGNYFSASWYEYVHIFAANDYIVFQPNYRGSTGYGEKFRKDLAGDYFNQAFDDIMTGVDYLIERGIVHPDSMGIMGWSAGGDFSNWALVSTNRFKAISTGAGVVNWVSFYGQVGDWMLLNEFHLGGTPYYNWDHYVNISPLKHIKNAQTPTLIHCGEDDRKIPRQQGDELYIALKKLRVPTEFIVYPNTGHGISDMRYQMVKMHAEFNWFEKWIRGKKGWIDWQEMIETLEEDNTQNSKNRKTQ